MVRFRFSWRLAAGGKLKVEQQIELRTLFDWSVEVGFELGSESRLFIHHDLGSAVSLSMATFGSQAWSHVTNHLEICE